jgi:hypothetical protein
LLVAGGSASIAVASLIWAMRVTDGARGGVEAWKKRARELEDKVAWADAIFGAHPGVVLIWEDRWPTAKAIGARRAFMAARWRWPACCASRIPPCR